MNEDGTVEFDLVWTAGRRVAWVREHALKCWVVGTHYTGLFLGRPSRGVMASSVQKGHFEFGIHCSSRSSRKRSALVARLILRHVALTVACVVAAAHWSLLLNMYGALQTKSSDVPLRAKCLFFLVTGQLKMGHDQTQIITSQPSRPWVA